MGNLFKLILFQFLLQGINAAPTDMEPKNWDDVIFDTQYGDDDCFSVLRLLLNHLKRGNIKFDAHNEKKELELIKTQLNEQESKLKFKEDLLDAKDEQIKYLKNVINEKNEKGIEQNEKYEQIKELLKTKNDLINAKDKQIRDLNDLIKVKKIIEQLHSQIEKTTENSQDLEHMNFRVEIITEKLIEDIAIIAENNEKQFKDIKDLINLKVKEFGEQLKTKNESEDKQINERKNAKNDKIGDLKAQVIANSKLLEEKNQLMIKYNQEENNLPDMGLNADIDQRVKTADKPAFEVPYISPLSGWTVIQRRMDGTVKFGRDWEDYKKGFGDIPGEFFLGLEKLHLMTKSKPHELYIQMQDVNGTTKYAHYDNFKIGSEKENFKLISVGKYNGTAGDSLTNHVGNMFSTKDQDNDIAPGNCALSRGGWWYRNCACSFLNGQYYKDGISTGFGIAWGTWKNWDYKISLTFTQMMIRPRP